MKCTTCENGATETRVVHEYHADLIGAPFLVYLLDAAQEHWCANCNKKLDTVIPDLEGLLRVIAQTRACLPRKLTGSEIKFLRHAVGCKAKHFAQKLEMSAENLSRVENGMKPLGPQSEKLLRFYVLTKLIDDDLASKIGKEKINRIFDMKIEAFWDASKVIELYFVRRSIIDSEQGGGEDCKRYEPIEKIAA
jgi:DNA-binding transcriptional regulator YiaG